MVRFLLPRWLLILLLCMNSFQMSQGNLALDVPVQETQKPVEMVIEVDEPDKPAMVAARLEGDYEDYTIRNTYDIDYLSRDVVGMVGVPIEVSGRNGGAVEDFVSLVFVYDPQKLECEEMDLRVLWYNEAAGWSGEAGE